MSCVNNSYLRGRPRDPAIDIAILTVAREMVAEVGYAELSIAEVARRAQVSRPAVYRRWPSKMHLVHDALFPVAQAPALADTGDVATDLVAYVDRLAATYDRPGVVTGLLGLLSDLHRHPDLIEVVIGGLHSGAREQLAARLDTAVAAGQLNAGVDTDAVFDMLVGALMVNVLLGRARGDGFSATLVRAALEGISAR